MTQACKGCKGFLHFHSVSHEVLGVYSGSAKAQFGGEGGPVVELRSGDVVIIPAGVGHKNLGASGDFGVVGAYPEGQEDYDLLRSLDELEQARTNIAKVPAPKTDPVYGAGGPLFEHWK